MSTNNDFLDVSDTYKRTVLVLGLNGSRGIYEGRAFDSTKVHCAMSMSGDNRLGYTAAVLKFGKCDNFDFYKDKGLQFPAVCELELRKVGTGIDKDEEEIVGLRYVGLARVRVESLASPGSPAATERKAA